MTKFLRAYAIKKYGEEYIKGHVFECENSKSNRNAANEAVVSDLKGEH